MENKLKLRPLMLLGLVMLLGGSVVACTITPLASPQEPTTPTTSAPTASQATSAGGIPESGKVYTDPVQAFSVYVPSSWNQLSIPGGGGGFAALSNNPIDLGFRAMIIVQNLSAFNANETGEELASEDLSMSTMINPSTSVVSRGAITLTKGTTGYELRTKCKQGNADYYARKVWITRVAPTHSFYYEIWVDGDAASFARNETATDQFISSFTLEPIR